MGNLCPNAWGDSSMYEELSVDELKEGREEESLKIYEEELTEKRKEYQKRNHKMTKDERLSFMKDIQRIQGMRDQMSELVKIKQTVRDKMGLMTFRENTMQFMKKAEGMTAKMKETKSTFDDLMEKFQASQDKHDELKDDVESATMDFRDTDSIEKMKEKQLQDLERSLLGSSEFEEPSDEEEEEEDEEEEEEEEEKEKEKEKEKESDLEQGEVYQEKHRSTDSDGGGEEDIFEVLGAKKTNAPKVKLKLRRLKKEKTGKLKKTKKRRPQASSLWDTSDSQEKEDLEFVRQTLRQLRQMPKPPTNYPLMKEKEKEKEKIEYV